LSKYPSINILIPNSLCPSAYQAQPQQGLKDNLKFILNPFLSISAKKDAKYGQPHQIQTLITIGYLFQRLGTILIRHHKSILFKFRSLRLVLTFQKSQNSKKSTT